MASTTALLLALVALPAAAASLSEPLGRGGGMPGDVLCQSKLLAYKFASTIQPERDAAGMAVIGEATLSSPPGCVWLPGCPERS